MRQLKSIILTAVATYSDGGTCVWTARLDDKKEGGIGHDEICETFNFVEDQCHTVVGLADDATDEIVHELLGDEEGEDDNHGVQPWVPSYPLK